MDHKDRLNGDEKVVIEVEYDDLTAYCSPDCSGDVYVDGEKVGDIPSRDFTGAAPFRVDLVYHEAYPTKGEVRERLPQIEQECAEQFDARVDAVYDLISDSDDPLDTIMELEADDLNPQEL